MRIRPRGVAALACVALSLTFAAGRPAAAGDSVAPGIYQTSANRAGLAGGEEISVTGAGFGPGTTVVLGDALATDLVVEDASHLRFTVPRQQAPGVRTLTVRNAAGLAQARFTIEPAALSSLGPCEITTVAGGVGAVGDGMAADSTYVVLAPTRAALDAAGSVYVADRVNHRVRKIVRYGAYREIFTAVGNGRVGDDGDGGPAVAAALSAPSGVALDADGNLFVSDAEAHRVRRVDAVTGVVTTVAGTGDPGFSGDGGPATAAALNAPADVALDAAGNLFVSDKGNDRVRRVDAATGVVTTVAGGGEDSSTLGDGGPAVGAPLYFPEGIDVDPAGNLFIASSYARRVRRVDAKTGVITTVAGSDRGDLNPLEGPATEVALQGPYDVAVDADGSLYVADGEEGNGSDVGSSGSVRKVDASGYLTLLGRDSEFATGVALDDRSNLFVAYPERGLVLVDSASSGLFATLAGSGSTEPYQVGSFAEGALGLSAPTADLDVDPVGDLYLLPTFFSQQSVVRRVEASSGAVSAITSDTEFGTVATSIAVDQKGNVYVAELRDIFHGTSDIRRVPVGGTETKVIVGGGSKPARPGIAGRKVALLQQTSVAFGSGQLFVNAGGQALVVAPKSGAVRRVMSGNSGPIAVGPSGELYIAGYHIVLRAAAGGLGTIAGNGSEETSGDGGPATAAGLGFVLDVAVDPAGNLYILTGDRVRRVDAATGIITTVVGGDDAGYSGDGGLASAAHLFDAIALAVDGAGNLYVANDRGLVRAVRAGCK